MKMKRIIVIFLMLTLILSITGCSKAQNGELNVYNWGDYIDESLIEQFEEEYGIKVNYETYATNEDMYMKIKNGGTSYDIAIPSDYMIQKMINEDMLEKVDISKLENYTNIDSKYLNKDYDPNNEYSVPYFWGTVGILYNKALVEDTVDSWEILFNEKYAGQVLMLDSQRDSIMVALKLLGYSLNSTDLDELEEAKSLLLEQKPNVLAYVVDNGKDMMVANEASFMATWNGEAIALMDENEDLDFALPKEGTNLFFDAMVIPKGSKNIDNAHKFINFMLDEQVALVNTEYVGYSTPNAKVLELLPEEIRNSEIAYPNIEELENLEVFIDLGSELVKYNKIWTEIKAQ
jgi:spermidine/putrescine transport system substrate-binding protein